LTIDIHSHYGQWLSSSRADTPALFSALLDRFDIDATICSSGRAVQYDLASGNADVAELTRTDPRVFGAITVNPNRREASVAEIDRYAADDRFVAVKLHPDYCGVPADAPESLAVIAEAARRGLPLFLHTWGQAGVESACAVARAFPDMGVFLFHMGGNAWRHAIERAREHPNLMLEIISTIPEARRIKEAVETLGAERVFFGTDMTLLTPAFAFGLLDSAGLAGADREKVLGLNAKRYFDISPLSERNRT